jgi:aromatic ring hydroxylase
LDLILALTLIIHARNILDKKGKDQYMENMFPLYRYVTERGFEASALPNLYTTFAN